MQCDKMFKQKWREASDVSQMAFSKAHQELLIQLYRKQITRREYDSLVNELYVLETKGISK
ncbi:hypothetical protein BK703_15100 [Bacillus thuringiensis serovar silo]|nr:hypothetical protein BK703_15100 [Bacillus thuringiensis serovar silo]